MHELGSVFLCPMLLAITVYAGSAEFQLCNMLLQIFYPLQTFLMVNARRYILWTFFFGNFALTDSPNGPEDVDRGWFLLYVSSVGSRNIFHIESVSQPIAGWP